MKARKDSLIITVYGTPAPQGSKRHVGGGRMIEVSTKLKPWREACKWAALKYRKKHITGPVLVDITFTLPKPKNCPKNRLWPDARPDLDKMFRAVGDSLTDAGIIEDDSRIVKLRATKVFPGTGGRSLDSPGAVIEITKMGDENKC
jgi:Holliday junction resolvase RusA-like endonuclease